jgi:predicted lipid-binding transport protein (Tim44 family)
MTMFAAMRRFKNLFAVAALGLAVSFVAVDMAEARRAGGFSGFGSRGTRTFQAPPATRTAPQPAAPVDRTMTPRTQANQPGAQSPAAAQRPGGLFGGFGRSMMGGLLVGGLLGMMLGHGFGGGFGFLGMMLQMLLIGGAVMLAIRFFAQRRQQQQQPAYAGPGNNAQRNDYGQDYGQPSQSNAAPGGSSFKIPQIGALAGLAGASKPAAAAGQADEIGVTQTDLEYFEKTLREVQAAYAAEDYAALRRLTTPEAMSYLAEELGENATNGVKNDVSNVRLLQGDVAEAWNEEGRDYATVAMLYSSIDVMRDRTSGKVVKGDEKVETESTEMWTFVRRENTGWQVAAIQSAA